ncbi:MAG TPA: DUF1801 domain-containing protein [Gemmatales bacterium]|nr:DUF1801 domain-containing protein [Gemmatales bacterium]
MPTPKQSLESFFKKYDPAIARQGKAVLAKLRKRIPGAVEMVYDNYNGLVIGFGPTEKASHAVLSILLQPSWVTLCFLIGARLMDPDKRLRGEGNIVRHIRLDAVNDLDEPEIEALIEQSIELASPPFNRKQKGYMVIKSISAKQRPRRPIAK